MKKILLALLVLVSVVSIFGFVIVSQNAQRVEGSVTVGSEYNSTTTPNRVGNSSVATIRSGSVTLGSVVITGTSNGTMNIYDATTSDITKRTNNTPTSTLMVASFGANMATGTYPYDVQLNNGLLVEMVGNAPTTTITFR